MNVRPPKNSILWLIHAKNIIFNLFYEFILVLFLLIFIFSFLLKRRDKVRYDAKNAKNGVSSFWKLWRHKFNLKGVDRRHLSRRDWCEGYFCFLLVLLLYCHSTLASNLLGSHNSVLCKNNGTGQLFMSSVWPLRTCSISVWTITKKKTGQC